jgi:hypothetical protein
MGYGDYSILQHETMTALVKKFPLQQHIGSVLFKEEKIGAQTAEWDVIHQSREMADYIVPDGEGHIVANMGLDHKTATVALLKEKKQLKGSTLAWLRKPGKENGKLGEQKIKDELEDLNPKVKFVINYGIDVSHKPTVGVAWSDPAADIIGDLKNWKTLIQRDSGQKAETLYVNDTVMGYMCKNTAIVALMSDSLSMKALQEGVITKIVNLNIIIYDSGFKPKGGSYTKFIPDDVAIIVTAKGFAKEYTAPSLDIKSGFRPGKFSKSWITEDPAGVWVLVEENTLPVIEKVENIVYADLIP